MIYACAALLCVGMGSLSNALRPTRSVDLQRTFSTSCTLASDPCREIAASVSAASGVYHFGSANYEEDISHWASSSSQHALCSFEPGTPEDIGIALQILGQTRTPFAVKGGGHSTNQGFSSTEGVHIAMSRFSDVIYDPASQTVTVGAGLTWDTVYAALEPYGMNVVGGRVPGVGVAGFTLGGGYSWLTNQYGLTVDTVQAYELVMTNATVINVTETSSPDLFFALKGGLNNFGIVSRFTLKTFPQTEVWGGIIFYGASVLDKVSLATANFVANNTDLKAVIITSYNYILGQPGAMQLLFYNAPTPPVGIFDEFLAIPSEMKDISTRSFSSIVKAFPADAMYGSRASFNSISVTSFPLDFIQSVVNETSYCGEILSKSSFFVAFNVEPFHPTLYTHNTTASAYPSDRTRAFYPLLVYVGWQSPESDKIVQDTVRASIQKLRARAIDAGQSDVVDAVLYPNYALPDTPLADMYGENVPRLQAIKAEVDPKNVMGLTGGFKF